MIKRTLLPKIKEHLKRPEMSLIVGPRQAGKTTIMMALKKELDQKGKKTLFFSLDNDLDQPYFKSQASLIEKIRLEVGNDRAFVFIDEIQRRENVGLFLKGIYDRGLPYKFILSGSGSVELKEKVHESLAGRKRLFRLTTISFREFVNYKTNYAYENRLEEFFKIDSARVLGFLNEYLSFGGYPQVVLAKTREEKQALIGEIYQSYLERDIAGLLGIRKTESLTQLVKILAFQTGSLVNVSELSSTLGIAVKTIKNYLWYLEKTFIVKKITPFFKRIRKEIVKMPIYYFNDLGLKNYIQHRLGRRDLIQTNGHLFENFVLLQLLEQMELSSDIHFWRTKDGAEVDFVINQGLKPIPIEVKFTPLKKPTISRSFRSFIAKYQPKNGYIINLGEPMTKKIGPTQINFIRPYLSAKFMNKISRPILKGRNKIL